MNWKKKSLRDCRLYTILDKQALADESVKSFAERIKGLPVDIIQLRDKASSKGAILRDALTLEKSLDRKRTIFIINDHLDIAQLVDCDGVHLGQDDLPVEAARKLLGRQKIIGVSCHSLKQALEAQKRGADYISVGPVFATPTKPEYRAVGLKLIKDCRRRIKIPFFVIGGIDLKNLQRVISYGAEKAAVCRAVIKAKDIKETINSFNRILKA